MRTRFFREFQFSCLKKEDLMPHPLRACRNKVLSVTYRGYMKLLESNNIFLVLPVPGFKKYIVDVD